MPGIAVRFLCVFAGASTVASSTPALAARAQRTFVASSGNDLNPCTLMAPCRGIAAAIAQAKPGGEVIALDSAGYGPATITQSITISAPSGVFLFSPFNNNTRGGTP